MDARGGLDGLTTVFSVDEVALEVLGVETGALGAAGLGLADAAPPGLFEEPASFARRLSRIFTCNIQFS